MKINKSCLSNFYVVQQLNRKINKGPMSKEVGKETMILVLIY